MGGLFFFFIDGIGLGEDDADINPLRRFLSPYLHDTTFAADNVPLMGDDFLLLPIDAELGTAGLPQSATGQTSIMTGKNASRRLGYHMQAFPNAELIELIKEHNLFNDLLKAGVPATCANLYSEEFLEQRRRRKKNMLPVSALSLESAGIPYRYIEDYQKGRALFTDITNAFLQDTSYEIPLISPREGAERIARLFDDYRFVFFEYFLTDRYGHDRDYRLIEQEVWTLNEFLSELRKVSDSREDPIDILITSDHGNAEDNRSGDHTRNPVPFFFSGKGDDLIARYQTEVRDLTDIKSAILSYFGISAFGVSAAETTPSAGTGAEA